MWAFGRAILRSCGPLETEAPDVAVLFAPVDEESVGVHGHTGPLHVRTSCAPVRESSKEDGDGHLLTPNARGATRNCMRRAGWLVVESS